MSKANAHRRPKHISTVKRNGQPESSPTTLAVTAIETPEPYGDIDKWNEILYDQANKNHLHQDTLRWSLVGGFAAFFITSMAAINNPQFNQVSSVHRLLHELQLFLVGLGTIYLFIVMIEGWYYNLYLAQLVECEKRIVDKQNLIPVAHLDRRSVASTHPSFIFVLALIICGNAAHLWQFSAEQCEQWKWNRWIAVLCCAVYVAIFAVAAFIAKVPERIDRTLCRKSNC